jgi:hypothetical protein
MPHSVCAMRTVAACPLAVQCSAASALLSQLLLLPVSCGLFSFTSYGLSGLVLRQSNRYLVMRNTYLDFVLRICDGF